MINSKTSIFSDPKHVILAFFFVKFPMQTKRWLVGVTGGIAAYKVPELVRLLKKQGHEVRVVLSSGAKAFVSPMTLQAVSGNPVYSDLFDTDFEAAMGHIELARWATDILIAPLSANRLAALAMGMADDLLTTLCLATTAPIWVAPAMNKNMWHHPATMHNIETITARGMKILGPEWGEQACKEIGLGRMMDPQNMVDQLECIDQDLILKDLAILITAGPTREALDPVRYISNRSSGKMGFALAKAAVALGAKVTLISGPVALNTPAGVLRRDVTTAIEMHTEVMTHYTTANIFISTAAVADFRPEHYAVQKIKKNIHSKEAVHSIGMVSNPDILSDVSRASKNRPFCVGFAAETEQLESHGKQKLQAKKLDMIAINDISDATIGFDVDENALLVLTPTKSYAITKASKQQVALQLLQIISECYAKNKTKNS